jgi:hypothetical protein
MPERPVCSPAGRERGIRLCGLGGFLAAVGEDERFDEPRLPGGLDLLTKECRAAIPGFGEIFDRAVSVALGEPQASAAAERGGQQDAGRKVPEHPGRRKQLLRLLEATLLGERHHEPRRRQPVCELAAGFQRAADLELAARQVAALVGDQRLLAQRDGDQVRHRELFGVGAQDVHRALGVVQRVGVDLQCRRREGEAADREPARVVTMQAQREQLMSGAGGIRHGTIHGTVKFTAGATLDGGVTYNGAAKISGGSGAYDDVRRSARLKCRSADGGTHTTCTVKARLTHT